MTLLGMVLMSSFARALATTLIPSFCKMLVYNDTTSIVTRIELFPKDLMFSNLFKKPALFDVGFQLPNYSL